MPCFRAHQCAPPFPALQRVSPLMSHVSKLMNGLLPYPPLLLVSPHLQHATFLSSPTHSSLFLPSSESVLICDMLCFKAHHPAPPSSSPPVGESLFVTCHVLKLTNLLLPPWCHDSVESSSALFSYVALNCT